MAARTTTAKRYVTITEVAAFTALSEGTIRNLLATGQLTSFRPVPGRDLLELRQVERPTASASTAKTKAKHTKPVAR
jgi:hypothetical protein